MSGSSDKQTSQQTSPWGPQAGALTSAFANAQDAYGKASQATAPTDFTAQFTPDQLATFRSMVGYGGNNAIPQSAANAGSALTSAGTNATSGALSNLTNFDPSKATNPNTLVNQANQYVAGQDINGQVANSMLPALQQARDVTLPGIEQNAALTGNTNSSRTGIADGLVQRGLAEQSAGLGASLRNSAFHDGLALASGNANSNNAAALTAAAAAGTIGNTATNTGVNAGSTSINDQGNLFNLANAGGAGQQAAQQAYLTNLAQRYGSSITAPYAPLNGLMGIIGSNNWGGNSTGTEHTENTPSAFQVIGGLLGAAGSAAGTGGSLGWKPFR